MSEQKIYLVPIGSIKKEILDNLRDDLTRIYTASIDIIPERPIPLLAYDSKRKQYNSSIILEELISKIRIAKDNQRVLGILDVDLYAGDLNFVFGQAQINEGFCVISITRLRQEFYGLPKDEDLFRLRVLKEAVHELGHTYGLGHCQKPKCVMHFSNSLLDTDIKDYRFCPVCKERIKEWLCNLEH
ncbi:MAG: archaemetzincin family Zn-dependent metalloprotease [Candidatus Omnitrophica bacterium]|nr:archaemetzincin family Zn-dependent metalloprotease [Candidatus Omnitrophota bacterium]